MEDLEEVETEDSFKWNASPTSQVDFDDSLMKVPDTSLQWKARYKQKRRRKRNAEAEE